MFPNAIVGKDGGFAVKDLSLLTCWRLSYHWKVNFIIIWRDGGNWMLTKGRGWRKLPVMDQITVEYLLNTFKGRSSNG